MSNGPTDTSPYAQSPFGQNPPAQRPTELYAPGQDAAGQAWEQPTFTEREEQPVVWGQVVVPGENGLVVAPPTAQEQQLMLLRRLIFPIALVLAVVTGHWFTVVVLALVVTGSLRRQLAMSRRHRLQLAPTLR
ncbi:MAG: hypothetical protein LCH96_18075 [Actinobacteria bacterium]|nr:hypothetical protein [Actinomycetota bacterium]